MKTRKSLTTNTQIAALYDIRACLDCLEAHIAKDNPEAIEFFLNRIGQSVRFIKHTLPQPQLKPDS
jgi:hypothetical protein